MKLFVLSILFIISFGDDVVTLTDSNFNDFIKENPRVLVEFYAPWCGHCKALEPEYEKAAQTLKAENIEAVLAKVDATVHKELATRFQVQGFPTLKYFTKGNFDTPADYSGGRTSDTIVQWIQTRSMPAVTEITTEEEFTKFKKKGKAVAIVYVAKDSTENKLLPSFAEDNREAFLLGIVTDTALITKVGGTLNTLQLFTKFNNFEPVSFTGEFNEKNLKDFINSERFPLMDEIGPENYKDYVDRGLPLVWIALDTSDKEMLEKVKNSLIEYATMFKGKLSFAWVCKVKYGQHVTSLGIKENPGLLISLENDKFLYEGDLFDKEKLKKWFEDYKNGGLKQHLKSQPIPAENSEDVFVLVGSEFNKVIGQEKDVLVEFYAPWCGHCKQLAPEYEKVGKAFKDVDNVVVAKIDATENDTPEKIEGFPTLIFYPKGQTKGATYSGGRTAKDIIAYLKESATVDVSAAKEEL